MDLQQFMDEAHQCFGHDPATKTGDARTPEEYLDFVVGRSVSGKERPPSDECVPAFVSSFDKGRKPDQAALTNMMRCVSSLKRMFLLVPAEGAASELLFLPDASMEEPRSFQWQRAPFTGDYRDNIGWLFFKETMLPELEALVLAAEKGPVMQARDYVASKVERQQTVLYTKLLPEALRNAKSVTLAAATTHRDDAVTCFADGRALVCYVNETADALIADRRARGEPDDQLQKPEGWDAWCEAQRKRKGGESSIPDIPPPLVTGSQTREVSTSWLVERPTRFVPSPHAEGFERVHFRNWIADEPLNPYQRQPRFDELQTLLGKWFVDTEVRDYVLDSLASVLFGRHALRSTKVMFVTAGRADCGKTLFMKLVQTAFGDGFVNRTNGANIVSGAGDAACTTLVQQASGRRLLWIDELKGGKLGLGQLKEAFTSGLDMKARDAHSNKQVTYARGCTLWITCNPAQLPPKPEEDTLKKIAFLATEDVNGKRLLGRFVATVEGAEAASENGVDFPIDVSLQTRIEAGEFSGALIRTLVQRLRAKPTFDAGKDMPASLKAETAWPAEAGGGPSGAVAGRSLNEVLAECLEPATDTLLTRFNLFKHLATTELETWQRIGGPKTVVNGTHTKDGTAYATAIDASLRGTFPDCVPPEVFTKFNDSGMVYPCFLNLKGKTYPPKNKIESTSVLVGFRLKADDAASSAAGALTDLATGST